MELFKARTVFASNVLVSALPKNCRSPRPRNPTQDVEGRFLGACSCLSRPSAGAFGACGAAILFLRPVPRYRKIAVLRGCEIQLKT